MSKDRFTPPGKQPAPVGKAGKKGKGKRVVAVSQPPAAPPAKPIAAKSIAAKSAQPPAAPPAKPIAAKPAPPPQPRPSAPAKPAAVRPVAAQAPQSERSAAPWSISLEAALYALLALIAVAARLYALDRFPLQAAEGAGAWAAWGILHGLPDVAFGAQSPLPVFGATLSFLLFGDSDASARLLPALLGGLCAVVPYALRRELGRAGALIAAALLAVGPSFMFVSRSLDGGMIVVAGTLVLLACALYYRREEDERCIYVSAATLGVMFAADKTAGPAALILGLLGVSAWLRSDVERDLPREALRNGLLIFVGAAVLLGTGLLSNLQGLQAALIDPLAVWMAEMPSGTLGERFAFYLRVLLAYEPLVLVFALAALVAAVLGLRRSRKGDDGDESAGPAEERGTGPAEEADGEDDTFSLTPLLIAWSLLSLVFYVLIGDQSPASVVQLVLPLALLAAQFLGKLVESPDLAAAGKDVWLLAFVFILIAFSVVPWLNPSSLFGGRFASLERRIQTLTAVILGILMIGMVAIAVWYAVRMRLKGTLLALGAASALGLAVFTVHSAWQLNHVEWFGATEPMLMSRTAPDVRLLADDVVAISRTQGDDAIAITLDDRVGQPVRWYLRRFLAVTTTRSGTTTKTPVVIVPADAKDAMVKSLGGAYVNQRYRLSSTWQAQAPLMRWLRWVHVREQVTKVQATDVFAFYKLPQ